MIYTHIIINKKPFYVLVYSCIYYEYYMKLFRIFLLNKNDLMFTPFETPIKFASKKKICKSQYEYRITFPQNILIKTK